jgi:hypothetical protein
LQGRVPRGYDPAVQVAEIMLTLVTTMLEPRAVPDARSRDEPLCGDAVEPPALGEPALDDPALDDSPLADPDRAAELLIGDDPPMWPVTITWCPTCSARLTLASALSRISRAPLAPPAMLPELEGVLPACAPPVGVDPVLSVLDRGAPASERADASLLPAPLAAPPIFAFLSTKPPVLPVVAESADPGVLVADVVEPVALEPRCRQPVAVTCPACCVADAPVVGLVPCGVVVGACAAASVPHNATAVPNAAAH